MITDELVDLIADRADDDHRRSTVTFRLHGIYLPKLAEMGVVEYDQRSNVLRYIGDEVVESWLRYFEDGKE